MQGFDKGDACIRSRSKNKMGLIVQTSSSINQYVFRLRKDFNR
jgi:hypothetical protein